MLLSHDKIVTRPCILPSGGNRQNWNGFVRVVKRVPPPSPPPPPSLLSLAGVVPLQIGQRSE